MEGSTNFAQGLMQQYVMQDSVDYFLNALLELMITRPYREITVSELCGAVGLSRNTFYKYFKNKDGLLERLSERLTVAFQETMPFPCDLDSGFLHYFEFWYSLRNQVEILIRNDLFQTVADPNQQVILFLRQKRPVPGPDNDQAACRMMYDFVFAGCIRLVEDWCDGGFVQSPAQMAEVAVSVVRGGFASAPPR